MMWSLRSLVIKVIYESAMQKLRHYNNIILKLYYYSEPKRSRKSFLTLMTNDLNDHISRLSLEVKAQNAENSEEVIRVENGLETQRAQRTQRKCFFSNKEKLCVLCFSLCLSVFLLSVLCVENKSTTNHPLSEWRPPPWGS